MGRLFNTWMKRLEQRELPESHINAFGHLWNRRNSLTDDEWDDLQDHFEANAPYKITQEQTEKGLAWLRNQLYTPTGRIRKNAPDFLLDRADILEDFKEFELVGYEEFLPRPTSYYTMIRPIYRVVAKDGRFFDYIAVMWPSEGLSTVVALAHNDRMAILHEGKFA